MKVKLPKIYGQKLYSPDFYPILFVTSNIAYSAK